MITSSAGTFLGELLDLIKATSGKHPAVLYHYTGAASLKKILETKELLATHFEFTNDPTELRYGQSVVLKETARTLAGLGSNEAWAKPILDKVLAKIEHEGFHDDMPTFVACFSADNDNLGQWRAYAQDGRGYAVGFDTARWEYDKTNPDIGTTLVECSYDAEAMAKEIAEQQRRIIERGSQQRSSTISAGSQTGVDFDIEKALFMVGASATLRLKNPGFRDEKEWRLVALPDDSLRGKPNGQYVREVAGAFAPAIALRLSQKEQRLPLRRIVMGPCHAQEGRTKTAEYGLRELLRLTGNDVAKDGFIKSSRIPYRSRALNA